MEGIEMANGLIRNAAERKPELKDAYLASMDAPLEIISGRFGRLKKNEKPVKVHQPATSDEMTSMAESLHIVDHTVDVTQLDDITQHPVLAAFLDSHCRRRHYTFQVLCGYLVANIVCTKIIQYVKCIKRSM